MPDATTLTIFTTPKPFHGHTGVIQANAIQSWLALGPAVDILIFGDAEGTAEATARFTVRHVPTVGSNEYGTPLVSALFSEAERLSDSAILCYVNADIILLSDFVVAVRNLEKRYRSFLMVGRRRDLDVRERWNFHQPGAEKRLQALAAREGAWHGVTGLDYFVFSRGLWGALPPLAIGRTAWDNWLIYRARARGAHVIDATPVVTAIHQNHDYRHHPDGAVGVWNGAEAKRNQELTGGPRHAFTLLDATHVLTGAGVRPAMSVPHLKRRLVTAPLFFPGLAPMIDPVVHLVRRMRKRAGGSIP